MSVIQVGLVDTTGKLDPQLVQSAAAALNVQVIRDLPQYWNIKATVIYLPDTKKVPGEVWPVQLVPKLPPGEGGFHMDKHKQPYSEVIANPGSDAWTIDASHEIIEMLVDPYGNRLQSSRSIEISPNNTIVDGNGQFNYLVEACDPCEADAFAYSIQGVAVSDFITPHFYDPVVTPGTRYSFTGAIKAPRELLKGGYISYIDLETEEWRQILWVNPGSPVYNDLGPAPADKNLRVWIDSQIAKLKKRHSYARTTNHTLLAQCKSRRATLSKIALRRAKLYR